MDPFRVTPILPATAMKTYQVIAPKETHWRKATCAEAGCEAYQRGWRTAVDETTELGQRQAHYIRKSSRRAFVEAREGALTVFTFEAGQRCFGSHEVRTSKPEIFLVREGDWRGNPRGGGPRIHKRADDWVEDFATHQDRLADRLRQG